MLLQRFQQGNMLKKTIFELIAGELLKAAAVPDSPDRSVHAAVKASSNHGMQHFRSVSACAFCPNFVFMRCDSPAPKVESCLPRHKLMRRE